MREYSTNGWDGMQQIKRLKNEFFYEKAAEEWIKLEGYAQNTEVKKALISLYADYDSDCSPLIWFCLGCESASSEETCKGEDCCGCICCGIAICLMCNH